jgi:ABC-2 type transport system ATP-binding protein
LLPISVATTHQTWYNTPTRGLFGSEQEQNGGSTTVIRTENLTKRFPIPTADLREAAKQSGQSRVHQGRPWLTAVDGIDLEISPGEILALLGPNGAGKTTTIRMLASILQPTAGQAWVGGYHVVDQARQVRRVVGLLTEFPGLYLRMRASEYLDFFGELHGLDPEVRAAQIRSLVDRFGMGDVVHRRIGEYSKGMRQKLALVRAMLHNPSVLLLDEPTSAMDPYSAHQVRNAILNLRHGQRAILLCTHNLAEAEQLADRIAVIRRGRIVALGSSNQLKQNLLGPPLLELRLAHAVDGYLESAADLVHIEARGDTWIRFRTQNPDNVNPRLLRRLSAAGAQVVTLSQISQSLEEVYLEIVTGDPQDGGT